MTESTKEISNERIYTVPLREKCRVVPRYKKSNKAVKTIKEFIAKHMKLRDRDLKKVKLDKYVNEFVWSRGIRKPPSKVKVKAIRDVEKGIIHVELAEMSDYLKFKKAKEERTEKKSGESKKEEKQEKQITEESESKKAEETEKKAAIVEAGKNLEKAAAKSAKHITSGKISEPKHQIRKALQK